MKKIFSRPSYRRLAMMGYKPGQGLDDMSTFFEEGKVIPVIDKVFPLADTADAFRYFARGSYKGKVVIKIVDGHRSIVSSIVSNCKCSNSQISS